MSEPMIGPLRGLRVVEFAGQGPGPFACMVLGDLGADVIRVERPGVEPYPRRSSDLLARNRRTMCLDLKDAEGVRIARQLIDSVDVLVEGFRPGVMEKLGLGPDACLESNPRLVYGRITGWGQDGPLAKTAGHDIDYIAVSGTLHAIGRPDSGPVPPLNLVGDFGGGGMLLAVGVLAALYECRASGRGQVVDAAMVDGAALLATMVHGFLADGSWRDERGVNGLDGGAHFYDTYCCADGRHIALGAIEPQFYGELRAGLGLDDPDWDDQSPAAWPVLKTRLAEILRTRSRDDWCRQLSDGDACVAPVLSLAEAPDHPHNRARQTFIDVAGITQPAPAPRFGRTPSATPTPPVPPGAHTDAILRELGVSEVAIEVLRASGIVN